MTLGFASTFDGPFYLKHYTQLCPDCRAALDRCDEMIGATMEAALCTMLRVMRRAR